MMSIDSGRVRASIHGDQYLLVSIYTDGEVTSEDVSLVREFIERFDSPVPVLFLRQGSYSLSFEVQHALMEEAASRFKAVAYVDRSLQDQEYTGLAKSTYLKDVPVNSFFTKEEAEKWLSQYGGLPGKSPAPSET